MERPRPSTLAWAGLVGGVVAYDVLCPKNETLSERLDPVLESAPGRAFLYTAIGTTALHLTNLLPDRYDPFNRASQRLNQLKERE